MDGSNFIHIGGTPNDEPCAQIGKTEEATRWNRLECRAYIAALCIKYGDPSDKGCEFKSRREAHDFGSYYEVVCHFSPNIAGSIDYAIKAESGMSEWANANMRAPVIYNEFAQAVGFLPEPESWPLSSHVPYTSIA